MGDLGGGRCDGLRGGGGVVFAARVADTHGRGDGLTADVYVSGGQCGGTAPGLAGGAKPVPVRNESPGGGLTVVCFQLEFAMTLRACLATAVILSGTAAGAVTPAYTDDRSTPLAVVASLYNALNRQEYLRAWSYFAEGAVADYATFREGYQDTAVIDVAYGEVTSEGAAGTIFSTVPVAIAAHLADGSKAFFNGCYMLSQVQPAVQELPPFRPIQIKEGHLRPAQSMDIPADACQ